MDVNIKREGNVLIFNLSGTLDFESVTPFTQQFRQMLLKRTNEKIILNMENLNFVGSSNIGAFIRNLMEFNEMANKPKYCNLKNEFKRIFNMYSTDKPFEIYDTLESAMVVVGEPEDMMDDMDSEANIPIKSKARQVTH